MKVVKVDKETGAPPFSSHHRFMQWLESRPAVGLRRAAPPLPPRVLAVHHSNLTEELVDFHTEPC
jgi:hypothetical protein